MKFKIIFTIFNVIILFSFVLFFTAPLFVLGPDHFFDVIFKYWPALVLFIIAFALFNVYFIINWKFFSLVEKEDWNALTSYLENEIFNKKIFRSHYIKILINSYLASSDMDGLFKLKDFLEKNHPGLVNHYALAFGIPYLLAQNPVEAEKYFGKMLAQPKIQNHSWLKWNYSLSLMQQKQELPAQDSFIELLNEKSGALVFLLSLYMLNSFKLSEEKQRIVEKAKDEYKKQYAVQSVTNTLNQQKQNIEVICLSSTIQKAISWLFPKEQGINAN